MQGPLLKIPRHRYLYVPRALYQLLLLYTIMMIKINRSSYSTASYKYLVYVLCGR